MAAVTLWTFKTHHGVGRDTRVTLPASPRLVMPDKRSPIRRAVILRRVDPELRIAQFYSLMIERDLFGEVRLVRAWGSLRELAKRLDGPGEIEARGSRKVKTQPDPDGPGEVWGQNPGRKRQGHPLTNRRPESRWCPRGQVMEPSRELG